MVTRILLLFSVCVATTVATECFYKATHLRGTSYVEKSMMCEHGCCGTVDEQECCDGLNLWMLFAFILVGIFLIFVIITAVYLIMKQKNKKKERVGNTTNNQAFEDQPSTVDLSIFRTDNSGTSHPPAYSFTDHQHEYTAIERRSNPTGHFVQDRHRQNPGNTVDWSDMQNAGNTAAWGGMPNTGNTVSWRDSDFSYLDKYLERSKQAENDRRNPLVEYSALNRTGNMTSSSKLAAEFEVPLPYEHPDFTAESTYLGNTTEDTPESPTVEYSDNSQFHFMARNNS